MLALVAEGVREGTTKKLRFRPGAFIHIDETSLMSTTANEGAEENVARRKELVESLRQHCLSIFGGDASAKTESNVCANADRCPPLYVAPLENAMAVGEEVAKDDRDAVAGVPMVDVSEASGVANYADLIQNDATRDNRIRLGAFLKNLKTTTSKIRAAQLLRRKLISRVARSME